MRTRPPPALTVGCLWSIAGSLYQVNTLTGEDQCYPIGMTELARTRAALRELEANIREACVSRRPLLERQRQPFTMKQELNWFVYRTDAEPWLGTVESWAAENDGVPFGVRP
jgi:hypothetical protein